MADAGKLVERLIVLRDSGDLDRSDRNLLADACNAISDSTYRKPSDTEIARDAATTLRCPEFFELLMEGADASGGNTTRELMDDALKHVARTLAAGDQS